MNYRYLLELLLPDLKYNYDKNPNTGEQETVNSKQVNSVPLNESTLIC